MIKIYKLIYEGQVIYVGKTKLKLYRRKNSHNCSVPKDIYKESQIELIEETNDVSRERFWIQYYTSIGCILFNKRNGDHNNKSLKEYQKEYHKNKYQSKRKTPKRSKEDKLQYCREYYEKNKEDLRIKRKEWYEENKERLRNERNLKKIENS